MHITKFCLTKSFAVIFLMLILSACVTERQIIGEEPKASNADSRAENSARLAVGYMDLKKYETAENVLKKAIKESPKHSRLNYTYALLKLRLGETDKADKYFSAAIKSNSENSRAAHDYGFYLCSQGKHKEALKMFDLAISNPLFAEKSLSSLRAGECIFNKDNDLAESYFLAAFNYNPNLSTALFRLAELNFAKKKALSARAYYQRYLAVQPATSAALFLAYRIEMLADAKDEALKHRRNLLKKYPGSQEARQLRKSSQK